MNQNRLKRSNIEHSSPKSIGENILLRRSYIMYIYLALQCIVHSNVGAVRRNQPKESDRLNSLCKTDFFFFELNNIYL